MDLAEFILQRVAEDEALAREAATVSSNADPAEPVGAAWKTFGDRDHHTGLLVGSDSAPLWEAEGYYGMSPAHADHIARHDPAHVLADCEAKRAIVEVHRTIDAHVRQVALTDHEEARDARNTRAGLDVALKALALPYASHPDYDESWRP